MAKHAILKHLRMSPQKVRVVAGTIRGVKVEQALNSLKVSRLAAARPLNKLLLSAVANAEQEKGVDVDALFVKEIFVDAGSTWKRWMPRAKGSATPILKRTSHITIRLGER